MNKWAISIMASLLFVALSPALAQASLGVTLTSQRTSMTAGQNSLLTTIITGGDGNYNCLWSYTNFKVGTIPFAGNSCNVIFFGNSSDTASPDTINLAVTDGSGNSGGTVTYIAVDPALAFSITSSSYTVYVGSGVHIYNSTVNGSINFPGLTPYSFSYMTIPQNGVVYTQNNDFTFTSPGTYDLIETLTDENQASLSNSVSITVLPLTATPPTISITPTSQTIDAGQSVAFSNTTTQGTPGYTYSYTLSGGTLGNNNKVTFSTSGTYTVQETVTDSVGGTGQSNIATITVNPLPTISILPTSQTIDAGQSVAFSNTTTQGTPGYTYSYTLSGGTLGNNNKVTFSTSGTYTVQETVTDSVGGTGQSNIATITVNPLPTISILPTSQTIDAGQSVAFSNTTTQGTPGYTYSYTLSGGTLGNNNKVTFSTSGTYTVQETVTDSVGGTGQSNIATITVNPLPTISILPTSQTIDAGQSVAFSNTTTQGTPGYTYSYTLSGGTLGNNNKVTFSTSGTYTVQETVTDSVGGTGQSNIATITVNPQPTVSISSVLPNPTDIGVPITISANTVGGGTGTSTYSWSVAAGHACPGTESSTTTKSFTYTPSGTTSTCEFTVTVKDAVGGMGTATTNAITVNPLPTVVITAPPSATSADVGLPITVAASASGGTAPLSYSWAVSTGASCPGFTSANTASFSYTPSGTTSSQTTQSGAMPDCHQAPAPVNCQFTVTVTDSFGKKATATTPTITINKQLTVSISAPTSATSVNVGVPVTVTAIASNGTGAVSYSWAVPAGDSCPGFVSASAASFSYTPSATSTNCQFAVTATDSIGQKASATTPVITVTQPPVKGCTNSNSGKPISITGSYLTSTVQVTDQSAVIVTGSHDTITINMPGSNCNIAVQVTGSVDNVNIYNGTITLTETGSYGTTTMHNTILSAQTITGSMDTISGATINGNAFTITGSSNLVESVQVMALNSLQLTGSYVDLTLNMLTSKPMALTVTGSYDTLHTIGGTINLKMTGSYNTLYYHDTTIASQSITGTGDSLIKD